MLPAAAFPPGAVRWLWLSASPQPAMSQPRKAVKPRLCVCGWPGSRVLLSRIHGPLAPPPRACCPGTLCSCSSKAAAMVYYSFANSTWLAWDLPGTWLMAVLFITPFGCLSMILHTAVYPGPWNEHTMDVLASMSA